MGGKVLLADNNLSTQRMVELTLTAEFLDVMSVGDGVRAMRVAGDEAPDIVIADAKVPGKNGFELSKTFRESPALAHVPIILIFDSAESVDLARIRATGVNDYIVKPFKSKDLVDKVHALLSGGRSAAVAPAPAAAVPPAKPDGGKKTVKAKKKTDVLMDLTGSRPRALESEEEEEPEEVAPEAIEPAPPPPPRPREGTGRFKPPAKAAPPAPPAAASKADPFGFDLAGALAGDECLQEPAKPKKEPELDVGVDQTVFMTRQDLAKLAEGAKPRGKQEKPPQEEEGGFTMIMSKDETKSIRPEPRPAPPEPPPRPFSLPPPEPEPAPEDEEAGFHTLIMAKDELASMRARVASKGPPPPTRRATPSPAPPPSRVERTSAPHETAQPGEAMDLGPGDEVSAADATVSMRRPLIPAATPARERPRAVAPPGNDDPAIVRIVEEARAATDEELENLLCRISPDRADAVRRVGEELIQRLARRIVPEVAERLVKEEIERLKKQVV